MRVASFVAVVSTVAAVGCGLSVTGEMVAAADAGGGAADATPPPPPPPPDGVADAGGDASGDAGALPVCPPTSCGYDVQAGWSVVAFGDTTAPCPAGFDAADVRESPTAQSGACTCAGPACTVTTKPNCNIGSITSTYGSNSSCGNDGAVNNFANGVCQHVENSFGTWAGFPPAPPPGAPGACTAMGVADPTKVSTTASRLCVAPTCAAACDAAVGASFRACLVADGDQTCPADAPQKHVVGTAATVTCGACSSCSVSATGCTGSMTFYSDTSCGAGNVVKTIASSSCVNVNGASFRSYEWTGTATGVTCAAGGTSTPAPSLTGVRTVCCK